ncbi:MAG: hypothetical protein L0H96_17250 [Humibacillus sp.]|nr:hypothetical protein [Humibacillus sp.]MDN5778643.1 hypothetical protein [Humibacillus sp.]
MTDLWTHVAAERGALADDIAALTPEQWASRSLCLTGRSATSSPTSPSPRPRDRSRFFGQFAEAGISFDKYANAGPARQLGTDTGATLAGFPCRAGFEDLPARAKADVAR